MKLFTLTPLLLAACAPTYDASEVSSGISSTASLTTGQTVTLVAQQSGKCVDVPADATTTGVQLDQYSCNGTEAQSFRVTRNADDTFTFTNTHSGLCVDVTSDLATNGTAIEQSACNGTEAQSFTLVADATATGVYEIETASGSCLDVTKKSTANGAGIQQWSCTGGSNQKFAVTATGGATSSTATKYLSKLGAKCDGSDDTLAVIAAVTGARNNAYTLVVDCAATLDIGTNIDRSIFIDNETTVDFQGAGKFIVNNLFEPAFVIANTHDVLLTHWNVEYAASMPVSLETAGYYLAGKYHANSNGNGSGQFNDNVLSSWLTKNRGVKFVDGPTHGIWANWLGSVNISSIFFIIGDTKNVTISGLDLYSAHTDQPSDYIPFGFMLGLGYKSNESVTVSTPKFDATNASAAFAVPTDLTFDDITLYGIIMGFQGNTIGSTFSNITVKHVSDLQDASGNNVGGVGQNFPPPHLFYLNYQFAGDPALNNANLDIANINEVGPRLGNVRPGGGGYADSLKLGCNNCKVDGYKTNRKDGFMDVLNSNGLTVSNVVASFDSSFVDEYESWPGWRWPGGTANVAFKNVTFSNVTLTDVAAQSVAAPLGNNTAPLNSNIAMNDVNIVVQSWTKPSIVPTWKGLAPGALVTFTLKKQGTKQYLRP